MNPKRLLTSILIFVLCTPPVFAELENQVKDHPVPYLAMHGTDAVHWQQWNAATLERARKENKLLFVSIGFFSCYWCHVMQRESFRDVDIGRAMNAAFIPVIVDRELEPALDAQMLGFVERYRGSAGWPLNVVVTPEGYPLLGGVYFPRNELLALLRKLADQWKTSHVEMSALARQAAIETPAAEVAAAKLTRITARAALLRDAMELADPLSGGFGSQTKFPMSAQLLALLDLHAATPNAKLGEFLQLTLERMAALGLRDHLSGGFFRYSTEPTWYVPHYEKMLYDQALLARVYLRAARIFERAEFADIARETLDFVLARMRVGAGFVSSLSAVDAGGVEGGYYLWSAADLQRVLSGNELRVARDALNMKGTPATEGGYLPIPTRTAEQIAKSLELAQADAQKHLASARMKLLAERERRTVPVDTKILVSWNALMLMALTDAAQLNDSARYALPARELRDHLVKTFWRDGMLNRAVNTSGALDDYAYLAAALWHYAQRLGGDADRDLARALVEQAWVRFYHGGGWALNANALLPSGTPPPLLDDGALPAPSAMLMAVTLEIAARSNDVALRDRARDALARGAKLISDNPFHYASYTPLFEPAQ